MEPTTREVVERINYTASLATHPQYIDVILAPYRAITARMGNSQPLSAQDHATLKSVQQQLETYLVQHEPVRSFTPQSLRLQIDQHMRGNTNRRSRLQVAIILLAAVALAVSVLFLPEYAARGLQQQVQLGLTVAFAVLHLGAAWLFISALKSFKSPLRQAFTLICVAVIILGLSLLEQPIIEYFSLRQYALTSIVFPLQILIAGSCFHLGDCLYARLVGVRSRLISVVPILAGAIILAGITPFVPHQAPAFGEPELVFDLSAVIWSWIVWLPIISAFILPKVVRQLPSMYKPPAQALLLSMFPIIAVTGYQYYLRLTVGAQLAGTSAYILFGLIVVMGIALLRAGYIFNKVSRY